MKHAYIPRFCEKTIRDFIKQPEIIAVTGPRQAGKTTVIKHILETIENTVSYSFDDPLIAQAFSSDAHTFYQRYMKGYAIVFLDEIQYIKESGKILKLLYDTYPDVKIIALTIHEQIDQVRYMLNAGVHGYVLKDAAKDAKTNNASATSKAKSAEGKVKAATNKATAKVKKTAINVYYLLIY